MELIKFIKCDNCGESRPEKYKACAYCGNINEVKPKVNIAIEEKDNPEIFYLDDLLKKIDNALLKESSLRMQIANRKAKIKKITEVTPNNSGDVNITVNSQQIYVKESTYRILAQKEIKELYNQLKEDLWALEEFNNKY